MDLQTLFLYLAVKFLVAMAIPTAHLGVTVLKAYKDERRDAVKEYVQRHVPGEAWDEIAWTAVDVGLDELVDMTEDAVKNQGTETRFLFQPGKHELTNLIYGEAKSKVYHLP